MVVGTAAAILGSAALGAGVSMLSGNKAASAASDAAAQSAGVQKYMYDTTRSDYAPYRTVGENALYKMSDLMGVSRPNQPQNTPGKPGVGLSGYPSFGGMTGMGGLYGSTAMTPASSAAPSMTPGYSGFEASPGYQFRLDQGNQAIQRSAAARGLLQSGGTVKAIDRYSQGIASDEYNNFYNRLAALAGVGQSATSGTAAAGTASANGQSNAAMAAGDARASSYLTTGSAINNGINNAMYGYMKYGSGGGLPMNPGFDNSISGGA